MIVLADRGFISYELWREAAATRPNSWRVIDAVEVPVLEWLPDDSYRSELVPPAHPRRRSGPFRVVEYMVTNRGESTETIRLITTYPRRRGGTGIGAGLTDLLCESPGLRARPPAVRYTRRTDGGVPRHGCKMRRNDLPPLPDLGELMGLVIIGGLVKHRLHEIDPETRAARRVVARVLTGRACTARSAVPFSGRPQHIPGPITNASGVPS